MTTPENAEEQQVQDQKNTDKEYNFAQIRKQLEQERAEKQRMQERLEQIERQQSAKSHSRDEDEDDEDDYDEPYIDKKHFKKTLAKEREEIKKAVKEEAIREARNLFHQEKQQSYLKNNPDFDQVMSQEVMQKFVEKCPGIAEGILSMPESFERQKLVYETIKAMNLHKDPEPQPSIQDKINANRKSPFYQPSNMSNSPYAAQGDFSGTGKKAAYDKMQELKNRMRLG